MLDWKNRGRKVTTLGEKIITIFTVVILLAIGLFAVRFAATITYMIRDFYQ
jgi:hypothetical protein